MVGGRGTGQQPGYIRVSLTVERSGPTSTSSRRSQRPPWPWLRWGIATSLLVAAVLVPFWLLEERLTLATDGWLLSGPGRIAAVSTIVLLLTADVLLPSPSSFVLTASGVLLGFVPGLAVGWAGLQCGALLGYAVGRSAGLRLALWLVGETELERASRAWRRWGDAILVASRAVPVLAESTVVVAGIARMRPVRFILLVGCSNAGISAVYAGVGARARGAAGFLAAFAAALIVPGALMLMARLALRRRQVSQGDDGSSRGRHGEDHGRWAGL